MSAPDKVTTPPTMVGTYGRAWLLPIWPRLLKVPNSSVCGWLFEASWAHPVWHSYVLSLIHLRDTPGLSAAHISLPGATHEFFLYALNPAFSREETIRTGPVHNLTPANFGAQFIAADDAAAVQRMEDTVRDVISGQLNPDTDAIRQWVARFGDNMMKKA